MGYKTKWKTVLSFSSDEYVKCITTTRHDNILLDIREHNFIIRYFTKNELNTFFKVHRLYGMTGVPPVVEHILGHTPIS